VIIPLAVDLGALTSFEPLPGGEWTSGAAGAAVAAVAVTLFAATGERYRTLEWISKPIAATTFLVAAGLAGTPAVVPFGTAIFVGLCLSWCGDVFLIPKDKRWFLVGLVAFLLGHVAYLVAFVIRGLDPIATISAAVALAAVGAVVLRWLEPHVESKMRRPVRAYVVVISLMVAAALGTVVEHGNPWLLVGAFAFYLSDLAVAHHRFVRATVLDRFWGLPLYFGAQWILALAGALG